MEPVRKPVKHKYLFPVKHLMFDYIWPIIETADNRMIDQRVCILLVHWKHERVCTKESNPSICYYLKHMKRPFLVSRDVLGFVTLYQAVAK